MHPLHPRLLHKAHLGSSLPGGRRLMCVMAAARGPRLAPGLFSPGRKQGRGAALPATPRSTGRARTRAAAARSTTTRSSASTAHGAAQPSSSGLRGGGQRWSPSHRAHATAPRPNAITSSHGIPGARAEEAAEGARVSEDESYVGGEAGARRSLAWSAELRCGPRRE